MVVSHHVGARNLDPLEEQPLISTSSFLPSRRTLQTQDTVPPVPAFSQPLATTNLLFSSTDLFWMFHINGVFVKRLFGGEGLPPFRWYNAFEGHPCGGTYLFILADG